MSDEDWLAVLGEPSGVDADSYPNAVALVRFVQKHARQLAGAVEVRRKGCWETVVLDFRTGRPQQSAYPIKPMERIGVLFVDDGSMPLVMMLRDDFPDTEHQQMVPEGFPKVICIDDRPWGEARLTWTPAELIQRILSWFKRAARGELHDAHQPIDPVLFGSLLTFIIPREAIGGGEDQNLIAIHDVQDKTTLKVIPIDQAGEPLKNAEPICLVTHRILPEQMTRMSYAPTTLGGLATILSDRGINLLGDLRTRFDAWLNDGATANWRMRARFAVIVEMPIMAPQGNRLKG